MWRSGKFPEHEDSDQSISEDDDLSGDLVEDHVSLGVSPEKKGEVQVLSQLDMLRDAQEVVRERNQTSLFQKRQLDSCAEDDVEFPVFDNKVDFNYSPRKASACNSDEEIISDNEDTRKDGICTWVAANAEADALVNLNDNAHCAYFRPVSAEAKRSHKGGQGKAKPKFSFLTKSHNAELFKDVNHMDRSHTSMKGKGTDELKNRVTPSELAVGNLLCVGEKHVLPQGSTEKFNRAKDEYTEFAVNRSISSLGHENLDDDLDSFGSRSSDEDQDNHQNLELIIPEPKPKTMADQFQEALGASSTNDQGHMHAVPINTGVGLFGKLQRVIQSEKQKDSNFLNTLQTEDKARCIDVKILSRSLEAKLTVCSCSPIKDNESSRIEDNAHTKKGIRRKTLTIIFSSRVCSDVELELGTLVRVHPPWKEVNAKGKEEMTILSTYFSRI